MIWEVRISLNFVDFENLVSRDERFVFTIVSFVVIGIIFLNLTFVGSVVVGFVASVCYFLVNGIFLGSAFFAEESVMLRIILGSLVLIAFLGFVGWLVMIIYNLDILRSVLVLCVVAILSSLTNRLKKRRRMEVK